MSELTNIYIYAWKRKLDYFRFSLDAEMWISQRRPMTPQFVCIKLLVWSKTRFWDLLWFQKVELNIFVRIRPRNSSYEYIYLKLECIDVALGILWMHNEGFYHVASNNLNQLYNVLAEFESLFAITTKVSLCNIHGRRSETFLWSLNCTYYEAFNSKTMFSSFFFIMAKLYFTPTLASLKGSIIF